VLLLCQGANNESSAGSQTGMSHEYDVRKTILTGYDRSIRPVRDATVPINVSLGVYVEHLETVCKLLLLFIVIIITHSHGSARVL